MFAPNLRRRQPPGRAPEQDRAPADETPTLSLDGWPSAWDIRIEPTLLAYGPLPVIDDGWQGDDEEAP